MVLVTTPYHVYKLIPKGYIRAKQFSLEFQAIQKANKGVPDNWLRSLKLGLKAQVDDEPRPPASKKQPSDTYLLSCWWPARWEGQKTPLYM